MKIAADHCPENVCLQQKATGINVPALEECKEGVVRIQYTYKHPLRATVSSEKACL